MISENRRPVANRRPYSRRARSRVRLAGFSAALLSLLVMFTWPALPASAYANLNYSGYTAKVQVNWAASAQPGFRVQTPSLIVYRNAYINTRFQQQVRVFETLQRWTGSVWVDSGGASQRALTEPGAGGAALIDARQVASTSATPGYYRLKYTVFWGVPPHFLTGATRITAIKHSSPRPVASCGAVRHAACSTQALYISTVDPDLARLR